MSLAKDEHILCVMFNNVVVLLTVFRGSAGGGGFGGMSAMGQMDPELELASDRTYCRVRIAASLKCCFSLC